MLQTLLEGFTVKPEDVQIWECNPLMVLRGADEVTYARPTKIEFTPFESSKTVFGHAIALEAAADGVSPQISIATRQYIDNPIEMARRQGIVLQGTDQNDLPVTWLINGAADRFMTTPEAEQIPYDEETAKLLEEELQGDPEKLNLNSYL